MSMQWEIEPSAGYLQVVATGGFSLPAAKRNFWEMLEAVAAHKCKKVLFDGRKLLGSPATMERFFYGEFAASAVAKFQSQGVSRATMFAYVLKEPVLDPNRFGETVAVNRGMQTKAFEDMEEARRWLGVIPASKPTTEDSGGQLVK